MGARMTPTSKGSAPDVVLMRSTGDAGHDARGRLKVLLVSDDNQNAAQTTRFYYLRVRI